MAGDSPHQQNVTKAYKKGTVCKARQHPAKQRCKRRKRDDRIPAGQINWVKHAYQHGEQDGAGKEHYKYFGAGLMAKDGKLFRRRRTGEQQNCQVHINAGNYSAVKSQNSVNGKYPAERWHEPPRRCSRRAVHLTQKRWQPK